MNLSEAVDFEFSESDMVKPLKNVTLSEADSTETFKFKPFEYERGAVTKTTKGIINTIRDMQDIPEQVKIFGKRISFGFGGYFGDTEEETERKKLNLITAERNLNEAQAERYRFSSQKETESLSYGVGGGIVNYGTMLIPAGAVGGGLKAIGKGAKAVNIGAEAAGLGTMSVMELAGQVQDKTPEELEAMTPEWARKATGGTIAYTAISAVTEKYVGFGQQMKMWQKPIKWGGNITSKSLTLLRTASINALSEGATEGIQDLEAAGIGLLDGTLEIDKLPARLQQAWKSAIIGGIIGGGVGTAAAMKSARNVKKQLMEMVAPVVGEQDAPAVAEAIFDSGTDDMTSAISIELELSSELKNKHGKVWNSMLAAVSREMDGKPRFEGMTEDERAHLANVYAKGFADNLLAEANFRGTTLDAVLSASDITYDNGLRIARKINIFDAIKNPEMIPPEAKQKRESLLAFIKRNGGVKDTYGDIKAMGALKQYPGLINNKNGMGLDEIGELAWQNEYWPSYMDRPDVNDVLEAIRDGLSGNHRYNEEEAQTFSDVIENYKQELDREGIDWENMTAAEIEQAVDEIPDMKSLMREAEFYEQNNFDFEYAATGMNEDERESYLERIAMQMYQLADENAQLDAENPAYEGETININGQDKTVYNSNGDRIAKSKEALENFYKWFGDSKVVDEQGRPLVVYHGSHADFSIFSKEHIGKGSGKLWGSGFYFTNDRKHAESIALGLFNRGKEAYLYPVYLRIENPLVDGKTGEIPEENDGRIQHGAGLNKEENYYVIKDSNQVKAIDNKGQFSRESENIYYQGAQSPKGMTTVTPDAYIIKLLEGADESTLPHELAHYWLSEMWNYVRSGRASEKYMQRWDNIAKYLNIRPEQTRLTPTQQEKFASSYEAYITRGNLPTPLIGSAFDDYDKWLQRVYNDYNKINYHVKRGNKVYSHPVRLTDAAVKFFQSMTTGTLEAPTLAPKDTGVAIPQEVEPQEVLEPKNEIVDNPTTYDTTRVINITEGEKGVSKVFQREAMKHADRIVDELGVSYNKINLEEQAIKASEWVQNNLEEARKVIDGAAAPEGIIDTAIFIAYENEMLRIGNNAEYQRALKIHSQVQTQRGQAIAAERISTDDVYNPAYWWKKLQKSKETQVAQKLFKGDTDALNKLIESETKNIMKEIAGKPKEQQVEALTKLAEKLQKDYNLETLYQMPDDINERTVKEFIKDTIGVNPDVMAGNEVINKAEQLQKLWENTKDKSGNPSVEAMRAKRELNDLIQAQTPSNVLAIWTSIFGRAFMLTSIKSPTLNIESNTIGGVTEAVVRRIVYGTTEKAVDKSVKQEFSKYAWEVYKASSDIVTTMNDYDDDMRIIGEQILHSQGQGRFRAASRVAEEVSFKYLMGAPDVLFKTLAFNDTADLLATKIAREEGAKDISKRATEIYKDAILIRPQTEQGQYVRKQAQQQAHYTTFTNDSWAAKFGLKARNFLNMIGNNKVRLGDLSMLFVKTPANVAMMGLEYGFGSLYTLYHVQDIIKNPQSEISQRSIKAAVRNGLGISLAALLYSMLDPDDYFSEFDTLNPKEKDRMRALNAMPNSIKIGNRWVSLDYFGELAIPLVGMLEAKRNNGLRSYVQSGLTQAAKIPGIKEIKELIDSMSEYARYDLPAEKIVQMMAGTVLDRARAMTIPAIVNDIAKMTDDYERDALGGVMDRFMASIPGLRQKLPERYGLQGVIRTEPALSTLFFGSRVKTGTEDRLVREVGKLSGKGEQPSISDVTKYGDLRLLSPEKKVMVRKEFYKQYNAETKKLISTRDYQNKSPEAKKKALNKVRSNVVKSLKQKYSNDIQREKRRR